MIRHAETDDQLARCVEICNAVQPAEPIALGDLKRDPGGELLLHAAGGYAFVAPSSATDAAYCMVRVHPDVRRRGVGSALLAAAADVARGFDKHAYWGRVSIGDDESLAFVSKRGFVETGREIMLERELTPADRGPAPPGVEPLRDEHLEGAYAVAVECVPDMPVGFDTQARSFEEWERALERDGAFVALDGGRVVGYAHLETRHATLDRREHGLTAVLRSHRGRGLAVALKQAQVSWAAVNGYRGLFTWTQEVNGAMRRVNEKLGYRIAAGSIAVRAPLT
jgi:mycothiol synthase